MRMKATPLVRLGAMTAAIVLGASSVGWALDCARVRQLIDDGQRPADVARELGITTPDVQACLAGVVDVPEPGEHRPQRVPFSVPGSADELRHPPHS